MPYIHILDSDTRRRAAVARTVMQLGIHAEIYEGYEEFAERIPEDGVILVAHSAASPLLTRLKGGEIELPVVVYSEQPVTRDVVDAIHAGALDFLEWPASGQYLNWVIERAVDAGDQLMGQIRKRSAARKLVGSLSPREHDVLLGVIAGGSNKAIAGELGISPRTVEIHRGNMMRKLGAASTGDAVRIALYAGLDSDLDLAA